MSARLPRRVFFQLLAIPGLCLLLSACGPRREPTPLDRGLEQLEQSNFGNAADLLKGVVETQPDSASAHCNLGIAQWKLGQIDLAMESFRRAAELAPEDARPMEFMARMFMETEHWKAAEQALAKARERSPQNPRILTSLAIVKLKMDDSAAARALLAEALDTRESYPPALFNMGMLCEEHLKQPEKAAEYFDAYLRVAGRDPHARIVEEHMRRIMEEPVTKDEEPPASEDKNADAPPRPQPPPPVVEAKPIREAVAEPVVVQEKPQPVPEPESKPSPMELVQQALDAQELDRALVLLKEILQEQPEHVDALWQLAVLYDEQLGQRAAAVAAYTDFMKIAPSDGPRAARARKRLEALRPPPRPTTPPQPKQPEPTPQKAPPPSVQSEEMTPPAEKTEAEKEEARRRTAVKIWAQGLQCHKAGEWDGAVALYKRALEYDKDLVGAWYNLGLVYKKEGLLDLALDAFQRAYKLDSDKSKAGYMLAVTQRDLDRRAQAVATLNDVLKAAPDYAKAHFLLGLLYKEQDADKQAAVHLRRYLELAPGDASAKRARMWLSEIDSQ